MAARKTGFLVGAVAGVGVAAAAMAGVGLRMSPAAAQDTSSQLIRASSVTPIFAPPPGAPMSFADIFEKVSPAVVSIDVTSRAAAQATNPLRGIPGFENFPFGGQGQGQGQGGQGQDDNEDTAPGGATPRGPRQQSSGSGFFVSEDGFIVTNNHVVENADEISITLKDGKEYKATVVGRDEGTDLAVIKVDDPKGRGVKFPYVSFENAAKPRVGDWVITIGNPFGLGGTATAGIISAYGRDIGDTPFVDYIQIDAPINRGNSGGPSFDIYGRVIGVNSAIYSPSGGSVGIGFAIPADTAESITKQLMTGGKIIPRGYIGATIQPFTSEMAETQGLADIEGAIVADLVAGGPAEAGGLRRGDVVTQVNGVGIKDSTGLTREVAKTQPGQTIRMDVLRDGRRQTVNIRAGARPSESELASNDNSGGARPGAPARPGGPATQQVLGLQVSGIDAAARTRYSLPATLNGVVVDSVRQGSDAAEKLRRGDVITSVNQRPVTTAAEMSAVIDAAKKSGRTSVLAGFVRAGRSAFLPLKIE